MSRRHFNAIMSLSLSSLLFFFFISAVASSENGGGGGGFTVDLFHRDSPHSPFYDPSTTRFERLRAAFNRSVSRQASFSSSPDSFGAPVTRVGGEYLMKIQVGTPPKEQLAVADTGSDITWIQCKPCLVRCYNQTLPIFDPEQSSSYGNVSCESDTCLAVKTSRFCTDGSCMYTIRYGDRSYTTGKLATETLTFDGGVSFPRVAVGCSFNSAGNFEPAGSGIVGLGGGPISLINQLRTSVGGRFSYCLASDPNTSSKISFGSDAIVDGPNVVSTPIAVTKSQETFYSLTLEAVSVGSARLDILSSPAANDGEVDEGNIIIDSGTELTLLPRDLYKKVEEEVTRAVARDRVADPQGVFQLCYRKESGFKSPTITAHFRGADLVLPEGSIFMEVEGGIVCFTVLRALSIPILGNLHQINYQVGYDLVKKEVRFLPTDCSKPHSH